MTLGTMPIVARLDLADAIRDRVERGDDTIHVVYEPGDMTHYEFVLVRLGAHPIVGATHDGSLMRLLDEDRWLLSSVEFGTMSVDLTLGHYTDPFYVAEKLHGAGPRIALGSAWVIAELLCLITRSEVMPPPART